MGFTEDMTYKAIIFKILNIRTGEHDTALDVKSLAHAVNCSKRNAYIIASNGGGRFKDFVVTSKSVDDYV